jgi:FAD synthetase
MFKSYFVWKVCFRYNLELKKCPGPIKHALGAVLAERPELKAVLMGTRRTDPYSETLNSFQVHTLNDTFTVKIK